MDVSVKPDTSEPSALRAIFDSVTTVLTVQKLVTRNQSSTKLKDLSRGLKNNFPGVLTQGLMGTSSIKHEPSNIFLP